MSLNSTGIKPEAFEGMRALNVQLYTESNVKLGLQYEVSLLLNPMAGSSINDTILVTGDKPISLKGRYLSFSGVGVAASIYEGPSYTGGVVFPYENANARNPVPGGVQVFSGATISDPGVRVFAVDYFIANSTNQSGGATGISGPQERILAPNTVYLFRLESLDSTDQLVSSFVTWYEGELDLPRDPS